MADGIDMMPAYPQVFVVDSQAPCVPGPVPAYPHTRRSMWRQRLLFALVGLALLGVLLEACCIYNLHKERNEESSSTAQVQKQRQECNETSKMTKKPEKETKPAALLIASHSQKKDVKKDEILLWTKEGDGFLIEMDYKDGFLTVKQEGIYFLYSKVAILESQCMARHTVQRVSPRYGNGSKPMDLMQSIRYLCPSSSQKDRQGITNMSSSYLGGAFHLFANDSIYVTLNVNMNPGVTMNFFGAFKL